MDIQDIKTLIEAGIPEARADVRDPQNDRTHLEATVIAEAFAGKPPVARHRMVYAALGDAFDGPLHALALTTVTPDEAKHKGLQI